MKSLEIEMNAPQLSVETFIIEIPIFSAGISEFFPDPKKGGSVLLTDS